MAGAAPSLVVRALRLLAQRERSREELRRKLAGEDADPRELEAVLDELQRKGLLSEARLAEQLTHAARGRYGSRHVLDRLRRKGVSAEALESATRALERQDLESARALWRKRFGRPPADLSERARQARFLAGRGFSGEVIREILGGEADDSQ